MCVQLFRMLPDRPSSHTKAAVQCRCSGVFSCIAFFFGTEDASLRFLLLYVLKVSELTGARLSGNKRPWVGRSHWRQ
jgi:hypothetical protein